MTETTATQKIAYDTSFTVLGTIGFCHLLNDMMQSLLPAIYPTLKTQFHLSFAQIGLVTLAFQCTASLFQPVVGYFADIRPMPYSLACRNPMKRPSGRLHEFMTCSQLLQKSISF